MQRRKPEETAAAFDRAARNAGVRYAFIGGMAVNAWGQPRATADVDCLLELRPGEETGFASALREEGFAVNPLDFIDARRDRSHVTIHDDHGLFHVDCKLAEGPVEAQQLEDAAHLSISTGTLRVARPEETIAFKIRFGSPQDIQDALSILRVQHGKLEEARLLAFAQKLGVESKLADLRNQV